jgi:hypothetical protein
VAGLLGALLLAGCKAMTTAAPTPTAVTAPRLEGSLPDALERALATESRDALETAGYLAAIDAAIERWNDPWAAPVVAAALDRLVWPSGELPEGIDHAIVHRSRQAYADVAARLSAAHRRAAAHPILGPMLAYSLHQLALETGAEREAADLRRLAGCVPEAALAGPLAWPALRSIDDDLGIPAQGPMPSALAGVPPFAATVQPERSYADACALDLEATGTGGGLRAFVVDVVVPHDGWVYVALGARARVRLDLAGETVIRRTQDTTNGTALTFGRAWVTAGRARLVVRVAPSELEERVTLQLVDGAGAPLATVVPAPGEVADARASRAAAIELVPEPTTSAELVTAASAELALGLDRRAARRLEHSPALPATPPAHLDRLRLRAYRFASERTGLALESERRSIASRAFASCPTCWDARVFAAQSALERLGKDTGTVAALGRLGVSPTSSLPNEGRSVPELAYLATLAAEGDLLDVSRAAFLELSRLAPGSALLARVDAELHERLGPDAVAYACEGGLSRGTTDCLMAHFENDDLPAALRELARLRRLRGSPSLHRRLELAKLLSHREIARAARLYDAMPPALRDSAVLALLPRDEGKQRLARDLEQLGDAPYGLEPITRLLGVSDDPATKLEAEGAELVARDRANAFLPGAGTAVLRHLERYDVSERGLLRYWTYDLRRVSDTEDVATHADAEEPLVGGRWTSRVLRRKIHKRDGRVLDPDPNAQGRQGHTDLSQLEKGDYVERIAVGWALPEDHGQLVVDTSDMMPERTSVRELELELIRPLRVPMKVWSHALLGEGRSEVRDGRLRTVWRLENQGPRRLERDVPPLEAQVGLSFGTDDYGRIARSIDEHVRRREDADPFLRRWVAEALGPSAASLDPLARIGRILGAIGKKVRLADAQDLSDRVGMIVGGTLESARTILERGSGSRTWVLYRALREAGIEAELAIAETKPFSASPNVPPRTGRFTHPLVRARVDGKALWLDADVEGPPLPPGRVSAELHGRLALLTDGSMVPVEAASDDDADGVELTLALDADGNASGSFRAVIHGRAAQQIAGALETQLGEQRTHLLRSIVQGWAPWADVRDVALSSDAGSWQIAVTARLEAASFALPDDRAGTSFSLPGLEPFHAVLPVPSSSSLAARYSGQADRTSALSVDTPLFYRVTRTITLPPGAKVSRAAPPVALTTGELSARRLVDVHDRTLVERFEVKLPVRVVQPEELDAFVSQLHTVDDGFAHATRASLRTTSTADAASGKDLPAKSPERAKVGRKPPMRKPTRTPKAPRSTTP